MDQELQIEILRRDVRYILENNMTYAKALNEVYPKMSNPKNLKYRLFPFLARGLPNSMNCCLDFSYDDISDNLFHITLLEFMNKGRIRYVTNKKILANRSHPTPVDEFEECVTKYILSINDILLDRVFKTISEIDEYLTEYMINGRTQIFKSM